MLKFNLVLPNTKPIFFALGTPIRDFTELWPQFVTILQDSIGAQITGEGVGPGGSYPPLSDTHKDRHGRVRPGGYARWKAKHCPGTGILQRSGKLLGSFFGGAGYVFESFPLSMSFGTSIEYAHYHQTGTRRGLPIRRPVDPTEQDATDLRTATARWVTQKYRAAGFRVLGGSATVGEAKAAGKTWYETQGGLPLAAGM
jgi:hypothetical protein